jgi:hypothetical protein
VHTLNPTASLQVAAQISSFPTEEGGSVKWTNKTTNTEGLKYKTTVIISQISKRGVLTICLVTRTVQFAGSPQFLWDRRRDQGGRSVPQPTVGVCRTADITLLQAASSCLLTSGVVMTGWIEEQGGTAVRLRDGRLASHGLGSRGWGETEICFETSRLADQSANEWVR